MRSLLVALFNRTAFRHLATQPSSHLTIELRPSGHPSCSPSQQVEVGTSPDLVTWGGCDVLETIAIILIVLWLLGMVSGYTLGNFIWVLLVIAVVLFLVRLVSGRRVV